MFHKDSAITGEKILQRRVDIMTKAYYIICDELYICCMMRLEEGPFRASENCIVADFKPIVIHPVLH